MYNTIIHSQYGKPQTIQIVKEPCADYKQDAKMLYNVLQEIPRKTWEELEKLFNENKWYQRTVLLNYNYINNPLTNT